MKLKKLIGLAIRKIIMNLPINNKKVVFISFDGGGYSCNPKYIAQEMLNRKKFKVFYKKM